MPSLPPPLPPETRTVGQLVAETVRLYRENFWPSLALGIPPAILVQITLKLSRELQVAVVAGAGAALLTLSFIGATMIVDRRRPPFKALATAYALGLITFPPAAVFAIAFALPGLAWLAFVGLAVPVAIIERLDWKNSFARGIQLGRADYVHALGSLATLVIAFFLTRTALIFALHGAGQSAIRIVSGVADLVLSPILFLGSALLYFDQAARADKLGRPEPAKGESDADLHPALDADGAGSADAEGESRPAARGEP